MITATPKYARAQVALHWLTLLLLLGSFVSHEWMKIAWRAITREGVVDLSIDIGTRVHVIIGISVLVLTLIRIVLRVTKGAPPPVAGQAPLITVASAIVHGLLYLVLLALPMTGMAAWFGLIETAADVHEVLFTTGLVLVAAHVLAALFHQFVIKDNLLSRMR